MQCDINIVQYGGNGWVFDRWPAAFREYVNASVIVTPRPIRGAAQYLFLTADYANGAPVEMMRRAVVMVHHLDPHPPKDLASRLPIYESARLCVAECDLFARVLRSAGVTTSIIPQGIDTTVFRPGFRLFAGSLLTIGVCGRNYADGRKGPGRMVAIATALDRMGVPARWVFCGPDWQPVADAIDAIGTQESRPWLGSMKYDTYPKYYRGIDALLVASEYEGGPYPALEALASGVPVVSTPVGHMSDLMVPETRNVVLYETPQAAAHALVTIHQNPPKTAELVASVAHRSWPEVMRQWAEVFGKGTR